MLPDFRVRQRDYLLEIARLLTEELDLEKLLARILKIAIEMLAGQAGLIALKESEGWRVATAHNIPPAFLSYLTPLLAEEKVAAVPGIAFGADDYLRISYATSMADIEKGLERIERFCKNLTK